MTLTNIITCILISVPLIVCASVVLIAIFDNDSKCYRFIWETELPGFVVSCFGVIGIIGGVVLSVWGLTELYATGQGFMFIPLLFILCGYFTRWIIGTIQKF